GQLGGDDLLRADVLPGRPPAGAVSGGGAGRGGADLQPVGRWAHPRAAGALGRDAVLRYLLRRLGWVLLVLLGVLTITYALMSFIPGDVAIFYAGPHASAQVIAETRHELGLDQPKIVQYARYLWLAVHGDFGQSATLDEPVLTAILQRVPATGLLALGVIVLEIGLAIIFGTLAALDEDGPIDRMVTWLAAMGVSLPGFWIGIVLLYLIAFKLKLLPLGG